MFNCSNQILLLELDAMLLKSGAMLLEFVLFSEAKERGASQANITLRPFNVY